MLTMERRLIGRFYFWPLIVALLLAGAGPLRAASPEKTVVQDVLYKADATPASGTLLISWTAFTAADGSAVAAGSMNVKVGAQGVVNVALVPNTGSMPASSYKVTLKLTDGTSSEEYWTVPAVATTTVAAIRSKMAPAAVAQQLVGRDYVDTKLAQVSVDTSSLVHMSGNETVAGVKTFGSSPQVPSPVNPQDAATKSYVDTKTANVLSSTGSYADPVWLSSMSATKLTGTIADAAIPATVARTNNVVSTSGNYADPVWLSSVSAAKVTGTLPDAAVPATVARLSGSQKFDTVSAGNLNKTIVLDGTKYAVSDAGFVAALADAAAQSGGATVVIPSTANVTLSAPRTVASNIKIRCDAGGTLTAGSATGLLTINGANTSVEGCTLNANGMVTGVVVSVPNATNFTFHKNSVTNTATNAGGSAGLLFTNGVNVTITDNSFTGIKDGGICGIGAGHDVTIRGNLVDGSVQTQAGTQICLNTTTANGAYYNVHIDSNTVTTVADFGIAIGTAAANSTFYNATVNNNTINIVNTTGTNSCEQLPLPRACGGISLNHTGMSRAVSFTGNTINAKGQRVDISGIEIGGCMGCTVANNNIDLTGDGTNYSKGSGILLDQTETNTTITGNVLIGWGSGAAYPGNIVILNGAKGTTISGNAMSAQAGSASANIMVECDAVGSSNLDVTITGNTVTGNLVAGSYGVLLRNQSGGSCPTSAHISGNVFDSTTAGIRAASADSTIDVGMNSFIGNTTNVVNNGTTGTPVEGPGLTSSGTIIPLQKAMQVQRSGSAAKVSLDASDGGGGAFLTHAGGGQFYYTCLNNCIFSSTNGGTLNWQNNGTTKGTWDANGKLTANGGIVVGASGSTIADSRELLQTVHHCGTTTTCANTANGSNREVYGKVTLASGAATLSGISPAFTSSSSFVCTCSDQTAAAACKAVPASGVERDIRGYIDGCDCIPVRGKLGK